MQVTFVISLPGYSKYPPTITGNTGRKESNVGYQYRPNRAKEGLWKRLECRPTDSAPNCPVVVA